MLAGKNDVLRKKNSAGVLNPDEPAPMFHYKLRTLMIVLAIGPFVLSAAIRTWFLFFGDWK